MDPRGDGVWRTALGVSLAALILASAGAAGCSSGAGAPPSAPPSPLPSSTGSAADPVISRVEGEDDSVAQYENSVVGLRIRFSAARYAIYDAPAELPAGMRFPDSQATIQMQGIMRNGSLWLVVVPTPRNRSPEEVADAYREAGVGIARALAAGYGSGTELEFGSPKVVQRRTIGGLPATVVERRGHEVVLGTEDMPIRIRSAVVVGRRYTYLLLLQVLANGFGEEFRSLDELLDGITISDGDAA